MIPQVDDIPIFRDPMKRNVYRFLFFLVLLTSHLMAVDKVAFTMKTTGDVRHKGEQVPDFQSLHRGTALFDGDFILTGEDGLAIALFLDDKSQLKIRQNTEAQILGTRKEGVISKQVSLAYGTLKATVEKQTRDFTVATPTSVASIKGSEFWLISDPDSGDIIISITGSIEITNLVSGRTYTLVPGTIVESTPDGEIKVLVAVKIRGEASSGISGGRFSLSGISVLEGDVGLDDLSGTMEVTNNTIFEGADLEVGAAITVTGILDEQTGNVTATLIEVSEPITIEGVASSSVVDSRFTVSDVTLVSGDAETLPSEVMITVRTVIEGGDIIAGADVTVIGYYNVETGRIEATQIVVVIPELKITASITSVTEGAIEVSGIAIVIGEIDIAALSGRIIITESTVIEGGELAVGAKITVTGTFDQETGNVLANRIFITEVVLLAVVNSPVVNNEFEIIDISVLEGDIDPSTLSGRVRLGPGTEIEGGEITPGLQVTVTGSVDESTGIFLATRIVVIVAERELIFDMEDNQGRRKELIIRFQ